MKTARQWFLLTALSPLLLISARAWWIIRRSKTLRPAKE
jgi:hypothetical protein